jgi:uncharacterized membrane protein YidH (DUF202 family)
VVVTIVFGLLAIALGVLLLVQRKERVAAARERGQGIKSPLVHNLVAVALVVFGLVYLATAFV